MQSNRTHNITAAVVATMSALWSASVASAQYRIGQDGHANDASNRVGSGGINEAGSPRYQLVTGNQIVTGNVTGGRAFQGNLPYTDPLAFRGRLPGQGVDDFVRDSYAAPAPNQPSFDLNTPRAFYGDSRGTNAPIGSVRQGFTGSYVGTSLSTNDPYASYLNAPGYQNLRLGNTSVIGATSNDSILTSITALPGSINGQVTSDALALGASANAGARPLGNGTPSDNYIANRFANIRSADGAPGPIGDAAIQQMRAELNNPDASVLTSGRITNQVDATLTNNASSPNAQGTLSNGGRTQSSNPFQPGGFNPSAKQTDNRLDSRIDSTQLNSSTDVAGQSLVPAGKQSSQYSELQSRLDRFQRSHDLTPTEQAIKLHQQQKPKPGSKTGTAINTAVNPGGGGTTRPAGTTPGTTQPAAAPDQTDANPANGPVDLTPLKVGSLATGIKAKGLHDLMSGAEDLMHHDKFASAIVKYNEAERVAPNNPLIPLGRAQAELGAGYYGKAESDLRRVFASDPAVLMGQYDLTSFLSQQRLDYLNKDLKDLANTEVRSERPWFLLAYIAYNTGDTPNASKYLDEADKRTSSKDPVLQLMRTHWTLTKAPATAPSDLNK